MHIALLAILYEGIDSISCQAELKFSALALTSDNLRGSMAGDEVEKICSSA